MMYEKNVKFSLEMSVLDEKCKKTSINIKKI